MMSNLGWGWDHNIYLIFSMYLVLSRWKIKGDNFPLAYPYVEFHKELAIEIEPIHKTLEQKC